MNRLCILILSLALTLGTAYAYPAIGGGRGLFRVQNALVEADAGLTVSLTALGRNPFFPGTADKGWVADLVAPELSYAPLVTRYLGLELFGSWGGIFQYPGNMADKKLDMGMHDLKAGAKLSLPVIPVLKLGFGGSYTFPVGDRSRRGWLDPVAIPKATDPAYTWTGMATLHFQDLAPSVPNLLVNYGRLNDLTNYGAGIELAATDFALYVEARSLQGTGSTGFLDTKHGEIRLTPGATFGSDNYGGTFKLGYSFGWGPTAVNELLLGIVIATPFGKRVPPQLGTLAGTVTDSRTGLPLAAKVAFPDNPKLKSLATDSLTGVFKTGKIPAGVLVVEVSAEGYHTQAIPINISAGSLVQHQFALKPRITYGVIAGLVTDAATNRPLAATIEFPGSNLTSITSDPVTGAFRMDNVPVGVYSVSATAPDHYKSTTTVQVEEGRIASPNFALRPLSTYGIVAGTVTDATTGKPLSAAIELSGTDVPSLVSDPATGSFRFDKVPVGVHSVTAAADGYFKSSSTVQVTEGGVATAQFVLRPLKLKTALTGKVSDKKTGAPLAATISFPGSDVPETATDPATGVYMTEVPVGSYAVKVTSRDYLDQTAAVVLQEGKPLVRDFELVQAGMTITLKGVYFDFNKATVKPESHSALADAAKILQDNPDIRVEIQGHTDNIGSDEYNQKLSEQRAWAVVNYLVQNFGVSAARLTAKGYGESRPIASNDTDGGRALNRRTEFVILK